MAAATTSLQKNLEDILHRNGSGRSANRTSNPVDSQQGGEPEQGQSVGVAIPGGMPRSHEEGKLLMAKGGTNNSPIYYKEQTVGNDDKLYEVMILIKPKIATISVVDNASSKVDHPQ